MAVPSSHTFVDGVLTSSEMNNYIRDPISFLYAPPIARLRQTSIQSIPTNTFTALLWDTEDVDTDISGVGGHSTSVNTSRYTSLYASWYLAGGGAGYAANATARRACAWAKNGTNISGSQIAVPATAANDCEIGARLIFVYLNVGDYLELMAFQESGGALNTNVTGAGQSTMDIYRLSN